MGEDDADQHGEFYGCLGPNIGSIHQSSSCITIVFDSTEQAKTDWFSQVTKPNNPCIKFSSEFRFV